MCKYTMWRQLCSVTALSKHCSFGLLPLLFCLKVHWQTFVYVCVACLCILLPIVNLNTVLLSNSWIFNMTHKSKAAVTIVNDKLFLVIMEKYYCWHYYQCNTSLFTFCQMFCPEDEQTWPYDCWFGPLISEHFEI